MTLYLLICLLCVHKAYWDCYNVRRWMVVLQVWGSFDWAPFCPICYLLRIVCCFLKLQWVKFGVFQRFWRDTQLFMVNKSNLQSQWFILTSMFLHICMKLLGMNWMLKWFLSMIDTWDCFHPFIVRRSCPCVMSNIVCESFSIIGIDSYPTRENKSVNQSCSKWFLLMRAAFTFLNLCFLNVINWWSGFSEVKPMSIIDEFINGLGRNYVDLNQEMDLAFVIFNFLIRLFWPNKSGRLFKTQLPCLAKCSKHNTLRHMIFLFFFMLIHYDPWLPRPRTFKPKRVAPQKKCLTVDELML